MERFKVFFHPGETPGLKTRVRKGFAEVSESGLCLESAGDPPIRIAKEAIRSVTMFRLYGLGRVIRVDHSEGTLFLSVVRLMIGQFAFVNFLRTGRLKEQLATLAMH
jgi:hypothetical protein